jgi:O-antigen/teichoic acid export membrane protein
MLKRVNHFSSKSLNEKLMSGGIWAATFKVIAGVFSLLINIMLVKILAPDDVGVFFLTHSMVTVFSLVAQFGLPQLIVRLVAESLATNDFPRIKSDITLTLIICCITCVTTSALVFIFAGDWLAINVFNSPLITTATGVISFWIVALTFQGLFVEIFRGLHDLKMASLFGGALTNVFLFMIMWVIWRYGDADYYTVVQFSAGSVFVSMALAGNILYRRLINLRSINLQFDIGRHLSETWPLWVTTLTLYILVQADLWIVAYFLDSSSVALYGAAARLIMMLALLVSLTYAVLPPIVAELNKKGDYQQLQSVLRAFAFGNTL